MNKTPRSLIYEVINGERDFQDEKWGTPQEHPHSIYEWIGIMEQELKEAKEAFFSHPADRLMLDEVRQVVAVGVACMEQHGFTKREMTYDKQSDGD